MLQHKIQFTLQKVAIAWMFALVTVNLPYVAIHALGIPAILIGLVLGLYPFFGPFQPFFGRFTQSHPLLGYYRTPYLLLGFFIGSIIFPFVPGLLQQVEGGSVGAAILLFILFFIFGTAIALMANTFLDLLSDVTTDDSRGTVTAAAWTGQTLAIALWAFVFRLIMPIYSHEAMLQLYIITPVVVMIIGFLSVVGLEPRHRDKEPHATEVNPLNESLALLTTGRMARRFFLFVTLSLLSIFLQDILQEPLGGDLFGMTAGETTIFSDYLQQCGGGRHDASRHYRNRQARRRESKALDGGSKTDRHDRRGSAQSLDFCCWRGVHWPVHRSLFQLALLLNGLCIGVFTFGSVTMMANMTVPGKTGKYLGVWSLGQALGLGLSFIIAGSLYSMLIGSQLFSPQLGYALIFTLEAAVMGWCVWSLQPADATELRRQAAVA